MAIEKKLLLRWKRPSSAFVLVIVITVVGLVVSVALPSLVLPKFAARPTTVNFQVHVIDDQAIPIPTAKVTVGAAAGQTDLDGYCEVPQDYLAKGIKGLTGTCRLEGDLRVEAPGYTSWQGSLADLFGRHYDYFSKGTNLAHEVTLFR